MSFLGHGLLSAFRLREQKEKGRAAVAQLNTTRPGHLQQPWECPDISFRELKARQTPAPKDSQQRRLQCASNHSFSCLKGHPVFAEGVPMELGL